MKTSISDDAIQRALEQFNAASSTPAAQPAQNPATQPSPVYTGPPVIIYDPGRSERKGANVGNMLLTIPVVLLMVLFAGLALYLMKDDIPLVMSILGLGGNIQSIDTRLTVTEVVPSNVGEEGQPVYGEDGSLQGCDGGKLITFDKNGNPSFVNPTISEGNNAVQDKIPIISEVKTTYCFDPKLWKEWQKIELPNHPGKTNKEALINHILAASGLNSELWFKAVTLAVEDSIGQDRLILPGRETTSVGEVNASENSGDSTSGEQGGGDYTGPDSGGGVNPSAEGGNEEPTPFQPADDTPTPTITPEPLSPEEAEKLQIQIALDANDLDYEEGGENTLFQLSKISLSDVLCQEGEGATVASLSPSGFKIVVENGKYWARSRSDSVDGRNLLKFMLTDTSTSVPDSQGGEWLIESGMIFYESNFGSNNANVWGEHNGFYEVPWCASWVFPVVIREDNPDDPGSVDLGPLETVIVNNKKKDGKNPDPTPTSGLHRDRPLPTPTPAYKAQMNMFEFEKLLLSSGLTSGSCIMNGWTGFCDVKGQKYTVEFGWFLSNSYELKTGNNFTLTMYPDYQGACLPVGGKWYGCPLVKLKPDG